MPNIEVSAIVLREGKVLVGCANGGKWETPGGGIQEGESILNATINAVFHCSGITVEPKNVMFVSEAFDPEHRIILYLYADYVSGELVAGESWDTIEWVDIRELGSLQEQMSDITVDAFYKFSLVLRQSAGRV